MSKLTKKRACPAVGRQITSAECGEHRGSKYQCPAACPFSPFASANYTQLLELEAAVDKASMIRIDQDAPDRAALAREIHRASNSPLPHALHALIVWRFVFETDAQGQSCAQRWERAGFSGLKNDGRVLLRAKMKLRIVLLEVHRVLDSEQVEVVDLLDAAPVPFIIRDRGFASSACRFATGLTWSYALPHYHRMCGSAILFQEIADLEPVESLHEVVRHLGGPTGEPAMRRWVAEHFARVSNALNAVGIERRRLMFAQIDAKFGKVVYELKRPFAECVAALDTLPDVEEDELADGEQREGFADARVWFASEADPTLAAATAPGAEVILGRVLLGQSHWRLEAMGAERIARLRQQFETHLGDRVHFTGERLDDLGQSIADKDPKTDRSLIPPRLLENPQVIKLATSRIPVPVTPTTKDALANETFAAMDREFLEHPVPALDGETPRAAAKNPALRAKLLRLMKNRVRATDERNLDTGSDQDMNWMLRELQLDEILFDAPPAGRQSKAFTTGALADGELPLPDDEADETVAYPMNPDLPPAPPLPKRPFTDVEIEKRLRAAVEGFERAADASAALETDGCTLLGDVDEVTMGLVADDAFPFLVPLLLQIWQVFVPRDTRGYNLTRGDLRAGILRESTALTKTFGQITPAAFDRHLDRGAQPALARAMVAQILSLAELQPRGTELAPEQLAVMSAVVCAVIEELDHAQRAHSR